MTKTLAFTLVAALGACAGSGTARVDYASSVTVRSPELVTVDVDLYTLADSDEPVFYTDNYYWLYRNDRWFRSRSYDRDWVYVSTPAARLRRIERPTAYIRYRSTHQEARRVPRPEQDHRDWHDGAPLQPTQPAQPAPPYPMPQNEPPQSEPPHHDHDLRSTTPGNAVRAMPPRERDDHRVDRDNRGHDDDKDRSKKKKAKDNDEKDKKHDH